MGSLINIIDYVKSEMRTFLEKPFSEVDSLVLSQFAYIDFGSVVPATGDKSKPVRVADILKAEFFNSMMGDVRDPESNYKLLFAMAASPRFRDLLMFNYADEYDKEEELQFSAVTFLFPDKTAYIAFRGTDNTLAGWKEDLNMAFASPVPSQMMAEKYLETVSSHLPQRVILGGHSKGGNLAVYSAMTASEKIKTRIEQIYDHDGPGFNSETLSKFDFESVQDKIYKTVPEVAIVGMLLESRTEYSVVKSKSIGVMQHDPFSWEIEDGEFKFTDKVLGVSKHLNATLDTWLSSASREKRELFVNTLFDIFNAGDNNTLGELKNNWMTNASLALKSTINMDPEVKKFLFQTFRELTISSVKNRKLLIK